MEDPIQKELDELRESYAAQNQQLKLVKAELNKLKEDAPAELATQKAEYEKQLASQAAQIEKLQADLAECHRLGVLPEQDSAERRAQLLSGAEKTRRRKAF